MLPRAAIRFLGGLVHCGTRLNRARYFSLKTGDDSKKGGDTLSRIAAPVKRVKLWSLSSAVLCISI